MTRPWQTIDREATSNGTLSLTRRGQDEFVIRIDNHVLMSSRYHRSEAELGRHAGQALGENPNPSVLVAGLGMGFTLRAALDVLPASARVTVAELEPVVVRWCRGPLRELTGSAIDDPRVDVCIADVAELISNAAPRAYDAIVLDVFQGTHDANDDPGHPIYGRSALERTRTALADAGVFAVWTEEPDVGFEKRLDLVGFSVERMRTGRGGPRYVVYLARKRGSKGRPRR
jgi:spermidine synthase